MMANVITGLRILVSVVLLFCPVFSPIFYVLYAENTGMTEFLYYEKVSKTAAMLA